MRLPFDFPGEEELPGGHCSRVWATATQVLKVSLRGEERTSGFIAAQRMSGIGGPRVLAADRSRSALLMERALPGTHLKNSDLTSDATRAIFIAHVRRLRSLPTEGLMTLAEFHSDGVTSAGGSERHELADLLATQGPTGFLHGDLHHENLLAHGGEWWVIDPKGLIGEAVFEGVAWLRNTAPDRVAEEATALCQEMAWDPSRLARWTRLDQMLDEPNVALVEALESLI